MAMNPRLLRPRASGFDPRSITGLAAWFDAADASTVTLVNDAVSQWNDKSGNGRNASQSTANNRPTYADTRNGRSVITFNGTSHTLTTGSFTQNQPSTMFLVARWASNASGTGGNAVDGFLSNRAGLYRRTTNNWGMFAGTELFSGTPDTNWHQFAGIYNSTSSALRVDGSQLTSGNVGSQNVTSGLALGSYNGTTSFFGGSIAEMLFYGGALSASQISSVERYLRSKWALP